MKLTTVFFLSLLAIVPFIGMEKPLLFDPSTHGGFLPSELHQELKKYLKYENRVELHKIFNEAMPKEFDPYSLNITMNSYVVDWEQNKIFCPKEGKIKIFDLTKKEFDPLTFDHNAFSLAYHVCSNRLFSGGYDGTIKIWDLKNKQCIKTLLKAHNGRVSALTYDKYNNRLFSADKYTIKIWNLTTHTCETTFINTDWDDCDTISLNYNENNNILAVTFRVYSFSNGRISEWTYHTNIWDLNTQTCIKTLSCNLDKQNTIYDHQKDRLFHPRRGFTMFNLSPLTIRQLLAIAKAVECKKIHTTLDKETFAWLDRGPNLEPVKEIIKKDIKVETDTSWLSSALLTTAELLFALK